MARQVYDIEVAAELVGDKLETTTRTLINRGAIKVRLYEPILGRSRPPSDKLLLSRMTLLKRRSSLSDGDIEHRARSAPVSSVFLR